jgi:hypothetical protein
MVGRCNVIGTGNAGAFWRWDRFLEKESRMDEAASKTAGMNKRRGHARNLLWIVLISLVTLLFYKDIYRADFFLDDYLHLHLVDRIDNPLIPYYTNLFMGAFFRPGIFLFWKINHAIFGLNAAGYYATNVAFLIALVALAYYLFFNLTGNRAFTALSTALLALSPITNVGVIWLSNRYDLIGAVFYLTSLLLFLRYVRFGKRSVYYGAIATGIFSYFCKEMMITLPAVMILSGAFMFFYRGELTRQRLARIAVLSTPFFTLGVLFILWRYGVIDSLGGYSGESKVSVTPAYLMTLYSGFAEYFWLMRWRMVFLLYLLAFILLLAKSNFVRSNPLTVFGLAVALVTASPLVMVFRIESVMTYMTPRFFFLPNLGMTIALASVYDPRGGKWRRRTAALFLIGTCMFFAVNTFMSTYKWAEDRIDNAKQMDKLAAYMEAQKTDGKLPGDLYYVLLYDTDVALDSGMKVRYPDLLDKAYFVNPVGPTQVIGSTDLHDKRGGDLNWPKTFNLNPCTYEELKYGVVLSTPRDIMTNMESSEGTLVTKDRLGKLVSADPEKVRGLLSTVGVLDHE